MTALNQLKEEIPKWTLATDKKLLNEVKNSADMIYEGITKVIGELQNVETSVDNCYIQIKHAMNWVNSLSYVKFIENNVNRPEDTSVSQSQPMPGVHISKTPEEILAKYRKAMEIALTDLNLKHIGSDEKMSQLEGETLEGNTMAAGGDYVTPELMGRIPLIIGTKEFIESPYIGLNFPNSSLTQLSLQAFNDTMNDSIKNIKNIVEDKKNINELPKDQEEDSFFAINERRNTGNLSEFNSKGNSNSKIQSELSYYSPAKSSNEPIVEAPKPPNIDVPEPPPIDVPEPPPIIEDEKRKSNNNLKSQSSTNKNDLTSTRFLKDNEEDDDDDDDFSGTRKQKGGKKSHGLI